MRTSTRALVTSACALLLFWSTGRSCASAADDQPLATTRAVRLLAPDLAAQGRPVRLEGTVTFADSDGTVFIQDDRAGTFFRRKDRSVPWKRGDRVAVVGSTFPGLYIPGVNASDVELLGHGALPAPTRCSAEDLASGRYHYMWVEVEGIGRSITVVGENATVVRVAVGPRVIEVRVNDVPPPELVLDDARLRIWGLAAGVINGQRELVVPYLKVAGFRDVTVIEPPSADLFGQPPTPIAHLLRFNPGGSGCRRVKVRGVVTAVWPPEHVFLREEQQGFLVVSKPSEPLQPGDVVEVLGFPEMGAARAHLADAAFRKVAHEPSPPPRPVSARDLLTGQRDADLVTLDGDLVAWYGTPDGDVLALQAGENVFRARCPGKSEVAAWPAGTRLSVTGICRIVGSTEKGFSLKPVSFEVWTRSPDDVRLLAAPSWWTARRLWLALGVLFVATLAAVVWATLLRRQVRAQTRIIREQLAREVVREERERIAREVHDTLEQELVGLSIRIDAATALADPRQIPLLETMRRLVGRAQTEVHELVWDLRDQALGPPSLPQTLQRLTDELGQSSPVRFGLTLRGDPWPLPLLMEHNLTRIAQEAVTNALKHADASALTIDVAFEPSRLVVRIVDDGRGFDVNGSNAQRPGHFGLTGMRERARKCGVTLNLDSRPGTGTVVELVAARPLDHNGTRVS